MTALVRASALVGYQETVAALGGRPDYFLSHFNIDPALLEAEDGVFPYRSFIKLIEMTADDLNCQDFGMQLAKRQGFLLLGPIALIGLNSPTVGDALRTMIKYLDFHSRATVSSIDTETDPHRPRITFDIALSGIGRRRHVDELAVSNIYQELRFMTQEAFVPEAILFRHSALLPAAHYQKYFHARVLFEQDVNAVVFKQEDLARRLDKANPRLQKLVADYVRQASASHPLDIAAQVKFLVRRLLPTANCGIQQIARNLCMHKRTLQRKLKDDNLDYENILDTIRAERAEELIKNSAMSMAQIATSLGYLEQASFNRACLRWFGLAPMKIRHQRMTTIIKQ